MSVELELSWGIVTQVPIAIGDALTLRVMTNKPLSNHVLSFAGDKYWSRKTVEFSGKSADIQLSPLAHVTFTDLAPIVLVLKNSAGKKVGAIKPSLMSYYFTKGIFNHADRLKANIFIFGMSGSGKSTFVNSVYTACSPDDKLVMRAIAGGSDTHVTCRLQAYPLYRVDDGLRGQLSRFRVLDSWGLDRNSYKNNEFKMILKGQLPQKFEMNQSMLKIKFDPTVVADRGVHSIIFFIAIGELQTDQPTPLLTATQQYIRESVKAGIQPFVAISMVDTLYDGFPHSGAYPEKEVQRASQILSLAEGNIFPIKSLVAKDGKRDFIIECRLLHLLSTAANCASNVRDLDDKDEDLDW